MIPKIIAHRGSYPENRIAGFKNSVKQGCNMIECDIRLTKNNIPVVLHDKSINRVCPGNYGYIHDILCIELEKYKIPTFDSLAKWTTEHNINIAIELKDLGNNKLNTILADKVVDIISKYNIIEKSYIISFNKDLIKYTKESYPFITTSIIFPFSFKNAFQLCDIYKSDHLWMHHKRINKYIVEKARQYHRKIYAWTVNDISHMERLSKLGVDGIVTDNPGVLSALLKSEEIFIV